MVLYQSQDAREKADTPCQLSRLRRYVGKVGASVFMVVYRALVQVAVRHSGSDSSNMTGLRLIGLADLHLDLSVRLSASTFGWMSRERFGSAVLFLFGG